MALMQNKKPAPVSQPSQDYKDSYGVLYVGGMAVVTISVDAKLSQNYQSAGIHGGVQFTTPAKDVEAAIKGATARIKSALNDELKKLSIALSDSMENGI